jgi:hypothetical protein
MARTSCISMGWWCLLCTRLTRLDGFFHSAHGLSILIPTKSFFVLSHSCCALSSETTKANYIVSAIFTVVLYRYFKEGRTVLFNSPETGRSITMDLEM